MKKVFIVTAILTAVFITGCNSKKSNVEMLTGQEWVLDEVRFSDSDFTETPPSGATVMFADTAKNVYGSGSCNRFFGTYTADENGKIDISVIGSTMMACPTLDFETRYFEWLEGADGFKVDGQSLQLTISENGTTLVYKPLLKAVL